MFTQAVVFPFPFGRIDFLSLTEPAGETEDQMLFVHSLYMVCRFAEGGKILLAESRGAPVPKRVPAPDAAEAGSA